jgi:hypothetical protein
MVGHEHCCGLAGLGGVWHLLDLPEGYHTAAREQNQTTHAPVVLRAAPGLPCGRAGARTTRCPTAPACKIIGDRAAPLEA